MSSNKELKKYRVFYWCANSSTEDSEVVSALTAEDALFCWKVNFQAVHSATTFVFRRIEAVL